jgi:U32 family peptidase
MKKVELLAPAGDLEKAKIAIMYGADAVYVGGKKFSLRARASNFDISDIKELTRFAKEFGAKVYVTMNIVPHNEDMDGLIEYLEDLVDAKIDAIIASSPYIIETAKQYAPSLEIHLSTQQSTMNSFATQYWLNEGISRVVLGREANLDEIKTIIDTTKADIEVFIHGGMCVAYSGRCMLSNHMTNRDANRGGCAHSCRWNYNLFEGDTLINEEGFYHFGSRDLMAIPYIPTMIDIGVGSLKIEGRMKSVYYIATVVRCYRNLIDEYYQKNGQISQEDIHHYLDEIKKAENRFAGSGFLSGTAGIDSQLYDMRAEQPTKEFIGYVLDYDNITKIATIEQRNYFEVYDTVEYFGPKLINTRDIIEEMWDQAGQPIEIARHPKQILKVKTSIQLHRHDMMRLVSRNKSDIVS